MHRGITVLCVLGVLGALLTLASCGDRPRSSADLSEAHAASYAHRQRRLAVGLEKRRRELLLEMAYGPYPKNETR